MQWDSAVTLIHILNIDMLNYHSLKGTMRKLAAIMFTDIAGYTALMSQDEGKALSFYRRTGRCSNPSSSSSAASG